MNLLRRIKPSSDFSRNVLKLFSSTVLASALNSLTLPIITRLYSPEQFGLYQLFLSVVLILGMVASLKYELAIVLPKEREDRDHLIVISLAVLVGMSILFFLVFEFFTEPILALFDAEKLSPYAILIPIGIFFTGLLQISRYILIHLKKFGDLARNKIYQVATQQGLAMAGGFAKQHFLGLFLAYTVGAIIPSLIVFGKRLFSFQHFNFEKAKTLAVQYKKFPLINSGSVFLNNLSLYLPVFMFSKFYDATTLGWFTLANQITIIPISLISTSVSQVYFQAASEAYNQSAGELVKIYWQTVKKMMLLGLAPFAGIVILAPVLTGIIFGQEWQEAGVFMQIVSLGIYFRFINIPIGSTFSIINRQEIALILIICSVLIRYGSMYLFRDNPVSMLWALSISTALFYIFYNLMVYVTIRKLQKSESE